jgi:hypothetical protein
MSQIAMARAIRQILAATGWLRNQRSDGGCESGQSAECMPSNQIRGSFDISLIA